jgi:hypothetical protein
MPRQSFFPLLALVVCAACLLAANQQSRPDGWTVLTVYGYWIVRISIEATLFFAFYLLVSLIPAMHGRKAVALCLAGFASYLPFVLSITAMDIVLGLPELETAAKATWDPDLRVGAFLLELAYLLDNHAFLCGLLALPLLTKTGWRLESRDYNVQFAKHRYVSSEQDIQSQSKPDQPSFFESLSPPFKCPLLRAEAQEHYVKLVGSTDTRMILYRFSDILRELPDTLGMQVHRSHWVANDAIVDVVRQGNNTRIETKDGMQIPVSRRYVGRVVKWAEQNVPTGNERTANTG